MEEEAKKLNEIFIKYITTKTPFVLLKMAMTLDGKIASRTGHSKWITGEAAREKVHYLRNYYDAVLVGVNTVFKDNPSLTCRILAGRDPIRIILDSRARTPVEAQVIIQDSAAPTYIVVTDRAPYDRVESLRATKARVIQVPADEQGRVSLKDLMVKLGEMEITGVLVEGGAEVAASFLEAGLVDKMLTFISPENSGRQDGSGTCRRVRKRKG